MKKGNFGYKVDYDIIFSKFPSRTLVYLPKSKKKIMITSNLNHYLQRKLGIKKKRRFVNGKWILSGPEVFYGIFQGTELYTRATLELVKNLESDLSKISYEDYEFSTLGNLISDNSFFSSPLNIPTLDCREYRESLGLSNSISDDLKNYILEVNKLLKPYMQKSDIKVRKKSHSGYPFFCYDKEKAFLVYYGFEMAEKFLERFLAEDFNWMLKNHLFPLFTQNERLTPMKHKVEKENGRLVFREGEKTVVNPDYVLWQNGKREKKPNILTKMDFKIDDHECIGKFASHGRVVLGMNISLNCYAQVVDGMVQNALKAFDVCKIDEGRSMHKDFVTKKCDYFLSWDYSSYDASNYGLILNYLFDDLLEGLVSKDWVYFLKCLRGSPQLFYSLEKGTNNPIILGELMNSSMLGGETSGFGMVAADGKYPSLMVSSHLLKSCFKVDTETILNNKSELFHCKLMGDNALFGFRTLSDKNVFKNFVLEKLDAKEIPFTLKMDSTANFCGYFWPDKSPLMIDASKFLESVIYSERDVSNKPFFALGFQDKLDRFMASGNSCRDIVYKRLKEMLSSFGHDIRNMTLTNPPKEVEFKYENNPMIQEIIDNPDKLIYKYNIKDFDPNLIEQFFTTIPKEWYEKVF